MIVNVSRYAYDRQSYYILMLILIDLHMIGNVSIFARYNWQC